MRKRLVVILVVLAAVGGLAGYLAGPFMARAHPRVQVAARVAREQREGLSERTLASEAYRDTGEPLEALYAEARHIEHNMSLGAALFGAWCGMVVAFKLGAVARERRRESYEADPARCLACGRCFISCPHERRRLAEETASVAEPRHVDTPS